MWKDICMTWHDHWYWKVLRELRFRASTISEKKMKMHMLLIKVACSFCFFLTLSYSRDEMYGNWFTDSNSSRGQPTLRHLRHYRNGRNDFRISSSRTEDYYLHGMWCVSEVHSSYWVPSFPGTFISHGNQSSSQSVVPQAVSSVRSGFEKNRFTK